MRPRCERKRCARKPPCIPIPRVCLDSVRIPTPRPCFLPPLTRTRLFIPPPCFQHPCIKRPVCHCTDEDYCTTETCRSSTNCKNSHPHFCPYGPKDEATDRNEPLYKRKRLEKIEGLKENDVDNSAKDVNYDQQEPITRKNAFQYKPPISYTPSLTYESDTSTTSSEIVRKQPIESLNRDKNALNTQNNDSLSSNIITPKGLSESINKPAPMKVPSTGTCNRSQFRSEPHTSHSPCDQQRADAMTETDFSNIIHTTQNSLPFTGQNCTSHSIPSLTKPNEQILDGNGMRPNSLNNRPYNGNHINQLPSNGQIVNPVKSTANASCQTSFTEGGTMSSDLLTLKPLECMHNVPYSDKPLTEQKQSVEQESYQSKRIMADNHRGFSEFKQPQQNYSDISSDNSSIRRNAIRQNQCSQICDEQRSKLENSFPTKSLHNNKTNLSAQKMSYENRLSPKDSLDVITTTKPHLAQRRNTSPVLRELNSRNTLSRQNEQSCASLQTMPEQQNNHQSNTNSPFQDQKMPVNTGNDNNGRTKQSGSHLNQIPETELHNNLSNDRHKDNSNVSKLTKQNIPVPNLTIINSQPVENLKENVITRKTCCNHGSQTCESCSGERKKTSSSGNQELSASKLRRGQVKSMQLGSQSSGNGTLDRGASITSRISKGSKNRRPRYGIDRESQFGRQKSNTSQITCLCPEKSTDELSCNKKVPCTHEAGLSVCSSTSCVVKEKHVNKSSGCTCCYPPAFSQLSCAGNINGTCTCSDNTKHNKSL